MDGFCGWRGDAACAQPRSCFDCLNGADAAACGIDTHGACVAVDQSSAVVLTGSKAQYCPDEDLECSACRRRWNTSEPSASSHGDRMIRGESCTGAGGCICMELCHDDQRSAALRNQSEWCASGPVVTAVVTAAEATLAPVTVQALAFEGTTETESWLYIIAVIGIPILILVCCCWGCVRCINRMKPIPDVIARRNAGTFEQDDGQVPYATIVGYVDLNARQGQPSVRMAS